MPKLIVTRGLPGSGYRDRAEDYVRAHARTTVMVDSDPLRAMLHAGVFIDGRDGTAALVKRMRNKLISVNLLAGKDVVCVDTNLEARGMRELHVLAVTHGAELAEWSTTHVHLTICVANDRVDTLWGVGEQRIRALAQRAKLHKTGGPAPTWEPEYGAEKITPYEADKLRPRGVIVDVDGTLARHDARSPYDYSRVRTDAPIDNVIRTVQALRAVGTRVIVVSGRPDSCREATEAWLDEHLRDWDELYMRAEGDTRNDAIVKLAIFNALIRNNVNVVGVFDDRDRVVRMWRTLGLTVFQVADGDF